MKVYVASAEKNKKNEVVERLRANGFEVINPWEHQDVVDIFKNDLELVDSCELLLCVMPTGGYAYGIICESMYAFLKNIPVYTITNELYKMPLFMKRISKIITEESFIQNFKGKT